METNRKAHILPWTIALVALCVIGLLWDQLSKGLQRNNEALEQMQLQNHHSADSVKESALVLRGQVDRLSQEVQQDRQFLLEQLELLRATRKHLDREATSDEATSTADIPESPDEVPSHTLLAFSELSHAEQQA